MGFSVTSRKDWGAEPRRCFAALPQGIPNVVIHHTADSPRGDEAAHMRATQAYHQESKGWCDIAYSFVIYPSGNIYAGRGWVIRPGATSGFNSVSYAICFAGNFESETPSTKALNAARWLIWQGKRRGLLAKDAAVIGHRDAPGASTACPGRNLYALLDVIRTPWTPPKRFRITKPSGKVVVRGLEGARALVRSLIGTMKRARKIIVRRTR